MATTIPHLSIQTTHIGQDIFTDSRTHGYAGPSRNAHLPRAGSNGGGAIANNEDGTQCALAGKESLRTVRVLPPLDSTTMFHAEASRNFWDGSGLKLDSASTDVAWGSGQFNGKILTSARNGELIMWDVNKAKYERRTKDHTRSIHKLSVSRIVQHYCITGSSDGDLRIWDIRALDRSISRIHYPTTIRSLVFSPTSSQPLQVMVGLDNGNIYRWDLKMAQRGQLDRVPVAHTAPVTALDWRAPDSASHGGTDVNVGLGWIVSGGLDRTVKIWDLTWPSVSSHIPHKPTYTLHPSFPVRQVLWRTGYDCELALVSNSDFTSGPNPDIGTTNLHRTGSAIALNSLEHSDRKPTPLGTHGAGDPIEIWDVRRGWIAKWSVVGSAVEGGVTGMTFGDSHAIWAQHSSGMFSQIDLRDTNKPLDSIPRVASTWEASGSMAFVADQKTLWEAPYDDIPSEQRDKLPDTKRASIKSLGDSTYYPKTQTTGTYNTSDNMDDLEVFSKLAKGYIFDGPDRQHICSVNAQLAFQAGKFHAGQVWLLVGASLSDIVPVEKTEKVYPPAMSHTPSSHREVPESPASNYTFPPTNGATPSKTSPNKPPELGHHVQRSTSGSRIMTPSSSKHSSPYLGPLILGPNNIPSTLVMTRRDSLDSPTSQGHNQSRRSSVYGRPSISSQRGASASASPGDRSLRHIGEGALDDSDSSGSGSGNEATNNGGGSSDEDLRGLLSPTLYAARTSASLPSPLSRIVNRTGSVPEDNDDDDEDEDEDSSPSPQSTDSEGSSPKSSPSPRLSSTSRSSRHSSLQKSKSRSRASTRGSATLAVRSVLRMASHSSIKTVTGGEPSVHINGLKAEETIRDLAHAREKSSAASDSVLDVQPQHPPPTPLEMTERRRDLIVNDEAKFRHMAWGALRETLEDFAHEGDIQMCAMLSLVAAKELKVKKRRVLAFLDAYIDVLTRLRLHICSAYLRKYCETDEIREVTLLQTTIYTACGRCRKALAVPLGASERNPNGGYWLCQNCKGQPITCSICRMPVRGLLFQCSICSHGGHHLCYQRYYMQRPMTDLPPKFMSGSFDDRGRSVTRSTANTLSLNDDDASSTLSGVGLGDSHNDTHRPLPSDKTDNLMGHPCAAGCGHFCWAAIGRRDD